MSQPKKKLKKGMETTQKIKLCFCFGAVDNRYRFAGKDNKNSLP